MLFLRNISAILNAYQKRTFSKDVRSRKSMADIHIIDREERSVKAVVIDGLLEPSTKSGIKFDNRRVFRCLDCDKEFLFSDEAINHKC